MTTKGRRPGGAPRSGSRSRSGAGSAGSGRGSQGDPGSPGSRGGEPGSDTSSGTPRAAWGRRLQAVPTGPNATGDPPTAPTSTVTASDAPATAFADEDDVLTAARTRAVERDVGAAGPSTVAAWSFLAAATGARSIVEIGTGVGVGAVALLRGMASDGLLTSIDVDAEHQRLARTACAEAGFGPSRLRMIAGRGQDVLPRLSDAAYDLVVVDATPTEHPALVPAAVRLLRPAGVVAVDRALSDRSVSDPVRRDRVSAALRETLRLVREDDRLVPLVLPLGDGILAAARRP